MRFTYIGGPTALIDWEGARVLTDPTFDPAGSAYALPGYTLRKTRGPAILPEAFGRVDAVLLSHDHHFDNLDRSGRSYVEKAPLVLTTKAGAERLGGRAVGLDHWQTHHLTPAGDGSLLITATPARHGPPNADRGPVIGFVLQTNEVAAGAVYISGDTVWYECVREVAGRFDVVVAILFLGAARVRAVGDWPLTFTAEEAVEVARAMPNALIVPVHYEGWEHYSESRPEVDRAFHEAGLKNRLVWPPPGRPTEIWPEEPKRGQNIMP